MTPNLKLRAARVMAGLSRKDMASILGKSTGAYSVRENGGQEFSPSEIAAIARRLNLTNDQIVDIFLPLSLTRT